MKKSILAVLSLSALILVSSCNQGKAADEKVAIEKVNTVSADTVKKKAVSTIDTVDYNKRMIALSNDTTGRWPVKTPYP